MIGERQAIKRVTMHTSPHELRSLAQSGMDALRKGDALKARESFQKLVKAGRADAPTYLGLAYACRSLKDGPGALAALDQVLAIEPRNLPALILKGDHLAEAGDARGASSFYQFALQIAPPPDQLPAELRGELSRAQRMCERYTAQFEAFLHQRLLGPEVADGQSSERFRHSLDLLLGKKKIYFQQPHTYFFPELPQIQFYDRNAFPWLDKVEAATADIRAELIEILKEGSAFTPYIEGDPMRPRKEQDGLTGSLDWSAFYLWKDGDVVADNASRCPRTMEALFEAPLARVKHRSPSVLFSQLRPHARIPPHSGLVNTRLICHLPLVVPPDCGFRVGNDVRTPMEGKAWVFDDTMEHEAWNRSDRTRVILLFDIWRPELSEQERRLVAAMFEAIDIYTGNKPAWGI